MQADALGYLIHVDACSEHTRGFPDLYIDFFSVIISEEWVCPSEQLRSISLTPPILLASPSLLFQCCLPSSGALVRLSVGINHWLRADPMAKAAQDRLWHTLSLLRDSIS